MTNEADTGQDPTSTLTSAFAVDAMQTREQMLVSIARPVARRHGELMKRLREGTNGSDITKTDSYLNALMREAADALAALPQESAPEPVEDAGAWKAVHRGTKSDINRGQDFFRVGPANDVDDPDCPCIHVFGPNKEARAKLIVAAVNALAIASIPTGVKDEPDWRDDPAADERWSAGLDYGQTQLCNVLGVDPAAVNWDAATETLDGDVQSVIGNILTARFGDDWSALISGGQTDLPVAEEPTADQITIAAIAFVGNDKWDSMDTFGRAKARTRARTALLSALSHPAPERVVEALRNVIDLVERDVIRVRPSDRDEFMAALATWYAALAQSAGGRNNG